MEEFLKSWFKPLKHILVTDRFKFILEFLKKEYSFKQVVPEKNNLFKAFYLCDYNNLKVVIIGKKPYSDLISINPRICRDIGLAYGNNSLSKTISPVLKEIQKELNVKNFDITLESWASQGVFLINESLTDIQGEDNNHQLIWNNFLTLILKTLSLEKQGILYVFFDKELAEKYKPYIDHNQNWIYEVDSIYESRIFNKLNSNLAIQQKTEIKWTN